MKLGIVGNGGIVQATLEAVKDADDISVSALWCRNESKGRPLCEKYDIEALYTDYDAFLKDDSFDTVYIGLVNSLHYEYAKKALLASKNVIVEKPFTSTYTQAKELFDLALEKDVYLFEAIMSRYSENYEELSKHLDDIGMIKIVRCNYSQYSRRFDAYQNGEVLPAFDPKLSGGALYDINVYNVHFLTGLFGAPSFSYYMANTGFNGIDTSGILLMNYGSFKAVCTGAKDSQSDSGIVIQGTKGEIEVNNRPGIIKNVILKFHDGSERKLDIKQEDDPLKQEFNKINEILNKKDFGTMMLWMNQSLQTMLVLENAREDIGLEF